MRLPLRLAPFAGDVLILALTLGAIFAFKGNPQESLDSLQAPVVFWKDSNQLWLMGQAVHSGVSPYRPLPELASAFLPQARFADHPTPYPPAIALIGALVAPLPYLEFARFWFWGQVLCLALSLTLLARRVSGGFDPLVIASVLTLGLSTGIATDELRLGQFTAMLLLVLTVASLLLSRGLEKSAGFLVGLMIALKVFAWPIALVFALRRRFRAALVAFVTAAALNLACLSFLSFPELVDYYTRIGPLNAGYWRGAEGNLSAWTVSGRLFSGFGFGLHVDPLWPNPQLASLTLAIAPAFLLAALLAASARARNPETAFGFSVMASVLLSPICWPFYFLLALVPAAILGERLARGGLPPRQIAAALLCLALFATRFDSYRHLVTPPGEFARLNFLQGLILLAPAVGVVGLGALLWMTDGPASPENSRHV